jgi:hypothetical protein
MSSLSRIWGNFRVGNKKQVEGANKGGQQQQDWLKIQDSDTDNSLIDGVLLR